MFYGEFRISGCRVTALSPDRGELKTGVRHLIVLRGFTTYFGLPVEELPEGPIGAHIRGRTAGGKAAIAADCGLDDRNVRIRITVR
jgi:hypothetical protein